MLLAHALITVDAEAVSYVDAFRMRAVTMQSLFFGNLVSFVSIEVI